MQEPDNTGKITALLKEMEDQHDSSINTLFQSLYLEIHALAVQQLRRLSPGETLTPTVLVHECYLRLIQQHKQKFKDSHHMLSHLAKVMRCYLVDSVRHKQTAKKQHCVITDAERIQGQDGFNLDLLDLEKNLLMMEKIDPQLTRLIEMRYFLGLKITEISELTQQSERHLYRQWQDARTLFIALSNRDKKPGLENTEK